MKRNVELARKITRLIVNKLPKNKNVFLNVQSFLEVLAILYKKDKKFRNFLVNPSIPIDKKIALIETLMKKMGQPEGIKSPLQYLISINAVSVLPEIKRFFEHEVEKIMKLSKGKLIVSHKIDKRIVNKIAKMVEGKLGRKIELEIEEDPKIIGGFILKTSSFVIDASVKRQLEKLISA